MWLWSWVRVLSGSAKVISVLFKCCSYKTKTTPSFSEDAVPREHLRSEWMPAQGKPAKDT